MKARIIAYFLIPISVITYCITLFASKESVETYYRNGLFQYIREGYDRTLGNLPFPMIYLVLFFLLLILIYQIRNFWMKKLWSTLIMHLLNLFLCAYISFYWLWGFNYSAPTIQDQLTLSNDNIDTTTIAQAASAQMALVNRLRNHIAQDTQVLSASLVPHDLENKVREVVVATLQQWNFDTQGKPRIRILKPKGTLLHIATAGVYLPWACEGHIDGGLSHIQWPFTMAHEMCHAYGVTDEGECNFVGLLACMKSSDLFIQYSGNLAYWRYLANALGGIAPTLFDAVVAEKSPAIRNDIKHIFTHLDAYPDILPDLRDLLYDSYLKANGVQDGLLSYDRVVELMLRYKQK